MAALVNNFKKDVVDNTLTKPGGANTIEWVKGVVEMCEKNPTLTRWSSQTTAGRSLLNWSTKFPEMRDLVELVRVWKEAGRDDLIERLKNLSVDEIKDEIRDAKNNNLIP